MATAGLTMAASLLFCMLVCQEGVSGDNFLYEPVIRYASTFFKPDVIPVTSANDPVLLTLNLTLLNIREFDLSRNQVEIDTWLVMEWNSGITFPGQHHAVEKIRFPVSKIWVPDMTPYNGYIELDEHIRVNQVVVNRDGTTLWVPKARIRFLCSVPEGSLSSGITCHLRIGSWTHHSDLLSLTSSPALDLSMYAVGDSLYEVLSATAMKESHVYHGSPEIYETILFSFTFREK